jgi:hypothetical protein
VEGPGFAFGIVDQVTFHPVDYLNAVLLASPVGVRKGLHYPVVSDGHRIMAQGSSELHELFHVNGSIQPTHFGVQMQFHPSNLGAIFQAGRGLCGGQAVNHERELIVVHLKLQVAPDYDPFPALNAQIHGLIQESLAANGISAVVHVKGDQDLARPRRARFERDHFPQDHHIVLRFLQLGNGNGVARYGAFQEAAAAPVGSAIAVGERRPVVGGPSVDLLNCILQIDIFWFVFVPPAAALGQGLSTQNAPQPLQGAAPLPLG